MNESTPIHSELLSADARGRKHVPVAVFAVIMIHVVLFVVLLIAAGCRASARAKAKTTTELAANQEQTNVPAAPLVPTAAAATAEPAVNPISLVSPIQSEPVMATEPQTETEAVSVAASSPVQQPEARISQPERERNPKPAIRAASKAQSPGIYVVQAGDTVGEIAKRHGTTVQAIKAANNLKSFLIHPGQKLRVKPQGQSSDSPFQVKSGKSKRSNEV